MDYCYYLMCIPDGGIDTLPESYICSTEYLREKGKCNAMLGIRDPNSITAHNTKQKG